MEFIIIIYLFFIFISLYLSFFFLLIYFENRKSMYKDAKIPEKLPRLTVLTSAYNEEDTIEDTIKSLLAVDYPKDLLEIIVINDGSTDKTLKIIKKFKDKIKIIDKENTGKADSLNQGIKQAKGEIIAVVDADSYPEKDSMLKIAGYFQDGRVAAVTAASLVKNQKTLLERMQGIEYTMIAWGRKLLDFIDSVYVTPGSLSIYRKKALIQAKGFDKNNITEDIEIAWKLLSLGYKLKMCLSAKVYTTVPNKIKQWWRQRVRWDIGGLQTMYKYKSSVLKRKYGMLGVFVAPYFLSSFVLSIFGFFVFLYIAIEKLISYFLYTKYSYTLKVTSMQVSSINLLPTVFTYFIVILLIISLIYVIIGLKTIHKSGLGLKRKRDIFLYLLLYLVFYPLILIQSIYLILNKKIRW